MRAIEQHFHEAVFSMLDKVVLTFMPVNETLVCDHSNESYLTVLSCSAQTLSSFQLLDVRVKGTKL